MKRISLLRMSMMALLMVSVAFTACDNRFIEVDYSNEIAGTWTFVEPDMAEALVISANGSVVSTGVKDGEYWEDVKGKVVVVNNKISMTFEDGDNYEGRFDLVPGEVLSFVNEQDGRRYTYRNCANDLSDEIQGMWVCNDGPLGIENNMAIQTFGQDGLATYTGIANEEGDFVVNGQITYNVVGDMMIQIMPEEYVGKGGSPYIVSKMTYAPKSTSMGDVLVQKEFTKMGDNVLEAQTSWLRIKKYLELPGKKYNYVSTYVTNSNGKDEDLNMMGYTFNISKMDGSNLDRMLKYLYFQVEFPNASTIKYKYKYSNQELVFEVPITVEGNKMTIHMTEINPVYRDVDMYVFQDAYNKQMHMYMPTYAFVNYFGNMDIAALTVENKIDLTDPAAVEAVFKHMDDCVDAINLSIVMKAEK